MRTQFIIVGLLCLCGVPISQSDRHKCRPELREDMSFVGNQITSLYSPDVKHCQQLCTQHPSCLFFTFVRPDQSGGNSKHFYCYLMSSRSGRPEHRIPLQGVTSGFSLKPCNPDPKPCLSQVYQNVDFSGADYQTLFTADYEECQRACNDDPSCQFYTFINGNFTSAEFRYKCQLKFSWTVPRAAKLEAKAGLVSGFSHKIQATQQHAAACPTTLFPNTEIPGNDMESLPAASPEHCHAFCTAHPLCTYFSHTSDDYMCYLKNNSNEMEVKAKERVTSGLPARSCQLDNNWVKKHHAGVDFWGSDLGDLLADDVDACQRACTEHPNCQFFTYVTESYSRPNLRRICYLKRVITMPAPPKVTKLANVVSGFSLMNCVNSALHIRTETETAHV